MTSKSRAADTAGKFAAFFGDMFSMLENSKQDQASTCERKTMNGHEKERYGSNTSPKECRDWSKLEGVFAKGRAQYRAIES
ncbi:hypothetical protein PoB_003790600 [Plakobranchus ocellatus]|uniref:Uncharacterized protein n=1 Tax=Plakobranchus ocellatus TaxID=259542 RepID=A0AAV4AXZ8_9GAST|nr:hypothetical protein PoB_003790600 [Plakobranchus ocellatus]